MSRKATESNTPSGLILRHILRGHNSSVRSVAWSPDGQMIASGATRFIRLWDAQTGALLDHIDVQERDYRFNQLAWSPNSQQIVSIASWLNYIDDAYLWDIRHHQVHNLSRQVNTHIANVGGVAWSPDGQTLALTDYYRVALFSTDSMLSTDTHQFFSYIETPITNLRKLTWLPGRQTLVAGGYNGFCVVDLSTKIVTRIDRFDARYGLACSPNGQILAFGTYDGTVELFNNDSILSKMHTLEGHIYPVDEIAWSSDGRILASQTAEELFLWRTDLWQPVAKIERARAYASVLAFHPNEPLLASSPLDRSYSFRIWQLDMDVLLSGTTGVSSVEYTNAKVALVGDSGVGKSGLALVLTGQKYEKTDSTHGRHIWTFSSEQVEARKGLWQQREILLWDLAGQPGYRVHHQLHLSEVAVALVIFDARDETDPFAGVAYWARALDEATKGFPLVKLLVAARTDRGTPFASRKQIEEIRQRYGFAGYYETSALRGDGVEELIQALREAIPWEKIPPITATELFYNVKSFLTDEKKSGDILRTLDNLLERYKRVALRTADDKLITVCIGRLESAGLVRSLVFGDWILLQPELLDDYCAWMAQAARAQKDGLGYLDENQAREGRFPMDAKRPLANKPAEERTLLLAVVEELVARRIAWRQETNEGVMLVFPSELRADMPDYPGSYAQVMTFTFDGPVRAIYATLTVGLLNSVTFEKHGLYRNAATFYGSRRQICGFVMDYPDPGNDSRGRLTVFFEANVTKDVKIQFLRFVNRQLE